MHLKLPRYLDQLIDIEDEMIIPGYENQMTATSGEKDRIPWWLNETVFYVLAYAFCSCPLRYTFRKRSKEHSFVLRKLYYVDPTGSNVGNLGGNGNITYNIVGNQGVVNIDPNNMGQPLVQVKNFSI